jgi:hypothetical protein
MAVIAEIKVRSMPVVGYKQPASTTGTQHATPSALRTFQTNVQQTTNRSPGFFFKLFLFISGSTWHLLRMEQLPLKGALYEP